MRNVNLPRRRWAVTIAVAVVSALGCAPAFADYSIVAVNDTNIEVGVAIAGCGKTELVDKVVLVPVVGAAAANTKASAAVNAAFLRGLRTPVPPKELLASIAPASTDVHSYALVKRERGAAVFGSNGTAATTPSSSDDKSTVVVSGDNLASPAVVTAATKAFKESKGSFAKRLAAALSAAEAAGGDAACRGKASTAAVLVSLRNDFLYNVYDFRPNFDATKEILPINDQHLPKVFVTALTTDGTSAVKKVDKLLAGADETKPIRLRQNAAADQSSLTRFALLCFGGAAVAIVLILFYRRKVMTETVDGQKRNRRSGHPAKR